MASPSLIAQVIECPSDRFTDLVTVAGLDPAVDLRGLPLSDIVIAPDENVSGYDFSGCIMRRATLRGVDLRGAKFARSDLTDADLTDAVFRPDQLETAVTVGAKGIAQRPDPLVVTGSLNQAAGASPRPMLFRSPAPGWHRTLYVNRGDLERRLTQRIVSSGGDCIVYGEKGAGKSALLSQVIDSLSQHGAYHNFVISGLRNDDPPGFVLMKGILQHGEGTFFDKFSEAFISRGKLSPLIARFDPQFCEQLEEEARLFGGVWPLEEMLIRLSDNERVTLFRDALRWVQETHGHETKILFIIEDADRLSEIDELIEITRDLSEATFVFVINELAGVQPDFSFGHRFAGGVFHVSTMSQADVEPIFDRMEAAFGQTVAFNAKSRAKILRLSHGLPSLVTLLAQRALDHAGYHAEIKPVLVKGEDVEAVVRTAIDEFDPRLRPSLAKGMRRAGHFGHVIFRAVRSAKAELSEAELIGAARGQRKRLISNALEELKNAGVLVLTRNGIKLAHPLLTTIFDLDHSGAQRRTS